MARQAKPPRRPRQQPTGNAIGVHPADRRLWQRGRVRRARPPCCWTPTTSPGPNHLCGLCQLLHRGQHRGSDGELLRFPERSVRRPAHEDGVLALVKKRRGGDLDCGPTFNLLRGTNLLRNLSVAGALTASYQNLDDTILIESDSYARSETYTQLETGAASTSAIDALDLSQFQNEAEVHALIATALVPYWDQGEVSSFVAGELANYATSSSVTSAISSALSSYDDSSQVDSKIITALLDFYTQAEVDQQIANALGNVDLSNYYTQAETQSYVANELLAFYPRTELDSQLTATFTQYWTSSRTQSEIDDAIAGAGFLTQAQADGRYFLVSAKELRVAGAH